MTTHMIPSQAWTQKRCRWQQREHTKKRLTQATSDKEQGSHICQAYVWPAGA